jgi:hypothetical protein
MDGASSKSIVVIIWISETKIKNIETYLNPSLYEMLVSTFYHWSHLQTTSSSLLVVVHSLTPFGGVIGEM